MKDIQAVCVAEFRPGDGRFLGSPNTVFWNAASIKTTKIGFPGIRTGKNALYIEKRRDEGSREELTTGHE